jgi:hypothetical protein
MNYTFQFNFSILKGDQAGFRFRSLDLKSYVFFIDGLGKYELDYYSDVTNGNTSTTIQSGASKLMHKGYRANNQLTLVAIGSIFYFYLNGQYLMTGVDQTLTMGLISLLVDSETAPTEAVYSQAVAWNIAGMAP